MQQGLISGESSIVDDGWVSVEKPTIEGIVNKTFKDAIKEAIVSTLTAFKDAVVSKFESIKEALSHREKSADIKHIPTVSGIKQQKSQANELSTEC